MSRLRHWMIVLLLFAILPQVTGAIAGERTESKTYYVGSDLDPVCTYSDIPSELRRDQRIGGACFELRGDEVEAAIVIEDLTEQSVGAAYGFETSSGNLIGGLVLFCGNTSADVPNGAAILNVYVGGPVVGPASCLLANKVGVGGTTGVITVTYQLGTPGGPPPIDEERDCLEFVPATAGITGITDEGQTVNLNVKVLLDGVNMQRGQQVFAKSAESYAPLNINLFMSSYVTVTMTGDDAQGLINQARAHEGGQRPADVDIVYTLTSKNIQAAPVGDAVVGLADCIGGVRYPDRAFAVGENTEFSGIPNTAAKTAAHEIGHLMGAHHHYANCAEGADHLPEDGPCTLMFNALNFLSRKFGTLEAAVVRGHAVDFASP